MRAELQPVVERHQPAREAQYDRKRPRDEQAGIDLAQICQLFCLGGAPACNRAPERRGDDGRQLLQRQPLPPQQIVGDIGDDLRIGLQRTAIAEHLHIAPVRVIGRDLPVVYDRIVEQRKRVRAAPPAGRVCRITPVCRPAIARIARRAGRTGPHPPGIPRP